MGQRWNEISRKTEFFEAYEAGKLGMQNSRAVEASTVASVWETTTSARGLHVELTKLRLAQLISSFATKKSSEREKPKNLPHAKSVNENQVRVIFVENCKDLFEGIRFQNRVNSTN